MKIVSFFWIIHKNNYTVSIEKYLKQLTVKIAVQFNGKVRGTLQVDADISQDDFIATVQADDHLAKYFPVTPKKIIFIPGKICNIVG